MNICSTRRIKSTLISYFAVFVPCQILNGLRINARVDQVRNIGMPQKMRRHVEIQAIGDVIPIDAFLPRLRLELLFDCLTVDVPIDRSLLYVLLLVSYSLTLSNTLLNLSAASCGSVILIFPAEANTQP